MHVITHIARPLFLHAPPVLENSDMCHHVAFKATTGFPASLSVVLDCGGGDDALYSSALCNLQYPASFVQSFFLIVILAWGQLGPHTLQTAVFVSHSAAVPFCSCQP